MKDNVTREQGEGMNEQQRIAIIGDVMRDVTIEVAVERVSPEAPCLIGRHLSETHTAGGAGNVAANVYALSGSDTVVALMSPYGDVGYETLLPEDMAIIRPNGWFGDTVPATKTRYIARGSQLFRYDDEDPAQTIDDDLVFLVEDELADWQPTALIFADYRKGICTPSLVGRLMKYAADNRIPVFVDTKPEAVSMYGGATLLKLNRKEASEVVGRKTPIRTKEEAADVARLIRCNHFPTFRNIVITLDGDGLVWMETRSQESGPPVLYADHIPALNADPVDVTGAGDTTLAALAVAMLRGETLEDAARYAARCAAEVVGIRGTAVATGEVL